MAAISPLLTVKPTRGLVDEKIQVIVNNLPPRFAVTLHSLFQSEDKDYWEAFGHYTSDNLGTVTVSEHASVGGTYEGTESMGLLWSMKPVPGSRTGLRLRKMNVLTPMMIHISVIDISEDGVKGTLFIPPGPGPFPGVLDLWGGGGGLMEYRSGLLASHGYVSMALEYLSPDMSKSPNLDFKYFEKAFKIVQEHPLVMKDRIALFGLCFGSSVTLKLAVYSKAISPRCCVCVSGTHVQPINKSISNFYTQVSIDLSGSRWDDHGCLVLRDSILPITNEPGQKVDMGRIKCPVMLIVGEDDQNWATVESAEDMIQMMRAAGNDHLLTTLRYPGAGHLIEPPYSPHTRASNFIIPLGRQKVVVLWGGSPKLHSDAQEDSWEKILSFLQQQLYPSQDAVPPARL
ncbi:hypothetical protein DPEC_G00109740 [Dallia pectoralis]|uniref:Uncharacterized protein n=1 Tax=Dallia pectoralis TaxID=75939 RepID=A0ACC2GT96_DALPE|nr:hypothetical protein DPEC_G00109740 [Dallia pectoralis]